MALAKGEEIHISPWAYRPNHFLGRGLIAHELTHVAQQRRGRNSARDNFLSGSGHDQAIQQLGKGIVRLVSFLKIGKKSDRKKTS